MLQFVLRLRDQYHGSYQNGSGRSTEKYASTRARVYLDTTTTLPEEAFSLSSVKVGEGQGEEANFIECPSPRPPTRSWRGESEDFWWLYRNAPPRLQADETRSHG